MAAFDVDGTLMRRDTLLPFLWRVAGPLRFVWHSLLLGPTLIRYALGYMENGEAKQRVLARFLQGRPVAEIQPIARQFAKETLPALVRPEALARLRWHQRQGHRTVLVSASMGMYLEPWAQSVGFDDVITTRLEVCDGCFSGGFDGENCYGPEKVRRLRQVVERLDACELYVYGDSAGDRELLDAADYAYFRCFDAPRAYDRAEDEADASATADRPSSTTWRKRLVQCVAAAAILYGGLSIWGGAAEVGAALSEVPVPVVGGLLGVVLFGYLVRFVRWHVYLRALGHEVPWRDNLRVFLASFALTVTPGKAGESIKALWLKERHDVAPASSLGGLFAERFTDVLALLLVILPGLSGRVYGQPLIVGVALVTAGLVFLLQKPAWIQRGLLAPLTRWTRDRDWDRVHRGVQMASRLLDRTRDLLRLRPLLGGTALGGVSWIAEGVVLYVVLQYLGVSFIAVHEAVLIHAVATLLGALSFLPGGLGGHEAASVALVMAYGATRPQALAATLLIRLFTLWFAVALGLAALTATPTPRPAGDTKGSPRSIPEGSAS